MNFRFSCLLFLGLIGFNTLLSQQSQNSSSVSKSRTGATLAYQPTKRLEISIEEQLRLKTVGRAYDRNLIQIGVDYDLLKTLKLGIAYRYINLYDDEGKQQGTKIRHRMHYRLRYKYEIRRSEFSIRGQFQHRRERGLDGELSEWENPYWRLKFGFEQDIRKWKLDPELGVEFFNQDLREDTEEDNNYRLSLGTTWKLSGPHEVNIKYMYEDGVGLSEQIPTHILAINYTYTLK